MCLKWADARRVSLRRKRRKSPSNKRKLFGIRWIVERSEDEEALVRSFKNGMIKTVKQFGEITLDTCKGKKDVEGQAARDKMTKGWEIKAIDMDTTRGTYKGCNCHEEEQWGDIWYGRWMVG